MQVRCPSCQTSIELSQDTVSGDVTCPACDSQFNFLGDVTVKSEFEGGSLGRFEIQDKLGAGAFGTVWKAYDTELDRTVALKIPHEQHPSKDAAESFLREARAAAQLKHPSIVAIHEIGRVNEKTFIVCDLVNGLTLGDRLSAGPMPVVESVKLTAEIAEALHAAHEAGIVHRDLKPSNVMLDEHNRPHVMDFGLAKREQGEVTVTEDGKILGTPAYMSPEQAKGASHTADRRADIYALGVMLFEMLTGEKPFRGSVRMLLHQVINDDPPSPRTLNSNVPLDLETICLKCLEKDPDRRYHTAAALAADLNRFLNGEPVVARPVGSLERLWRWCQRKPAIAGALGTIGVLLVAFSILAGYAYFTERHLRTTAENATNEAKTAQEAAVKAAASLRVAQTELMASMKATERALAASKESEAKALAEYRRAEEQRKIAGETLDGTVVSLRSLVDRAERQIAQMPDSVSLRIGILNDVSEIASQLHEFNPESPELKYLYGVILARLAYVHVFGNSDYIPNELPDSTWDRFYPLFQDAHTLIGEAASQMPDDYVVNKEYYYSQRRLMQMEAFVGNFDAALRLSEEGMVNAQALTTNFSGKSETGSILISAYISEARIHTAQGQNDEAIHTYLRVMDEYRRLVELHPDWTEQLQLDLSLTCRNLAQAYLGEGENENAIRWARESLDVALARHHSDQSQTLYYDYVFNGHDVLADIYFRSGQYDEALTSYESAVAFYSKFFPAKQVPWKKRIQIAQCQTLTGQFELAEGTLLGFAASIEKVREKSASAPVLSDLEWVTGLVVDLYTAWEKPEQAAEWQAKADAIAAQLATLKEEQAQRDQALQKSETESNAAPAEDSSEK